MPAPPTKVRRLVLALACSLSFLLYLHRYTWGFIKPDLKTEFGWDDAKLAHLDNFFVITYGVGQIPSGMLCDWIGARMLLGTGVLLWSLALCGIGLAVGWKTLVAARLTFGIGQAGCYPALGKISKSWFPISSRSTAQGWIATFFGRGGGAFSFILFGTVLSGRFKIPWREALFLFSAIGVVCGVAFVLLFRNSPREHPWVNTEEAELIEAGDAAATPDATVHSRLHWSSLLASSSIWFLFFRAFASNVADVLYSYWIPSYLIEARGMDKMSAGWMSALPLVGGALGGVASGWIQSRIIRKTDNRRWARSGVGFFGKAVAALLMLASLLSGNVYVTVGMFFIVKFFSDCEQPAEWGAVTDMAGRASATVFACVNSIGSLGGIIGGYIIGHSLKWFNAQGTSPITAWNWIFVMIAAEYLLAASAWLFIDSRKVLKTASATTSTGS